jgi:hypothetical protein
VARPILQTPDLRVAEAILDFARVDEFPAFAPAQVGSIEFATPECEAGNHERLPMPAGDLCPGCIAARPVRRIFSFRHNAFNLHRAGLPKNCPSVEINMITESQRTVLGWQQLTQRMLSHEERYAANIQWGDVQQVECIEDEIMRGALEVFRGDVGFERGEVRIAVLIDNDHFTINDCGLNTDVARGRYQHRKAMGPIIAATRIAIHLPVVDPDLQAIAVQLNLVNPLVGARGCQPRFGKTWLDEGRKLGALELIREFMLDPRKLRTCFKFTAIPDGDDRQDVKRELGRIAARIEEIGGERRRMFELYASDQLTRDAYINRNIALDKELDQLKRQKAAIAEAQSPSGFEDVDDAIRQFCDRAATRLERCADFDTKRQFLVDHIEKIIYHRDKVTVIGSVPIELKQARSVTGSTLQFHVVGHIDRAMVRRLPKGQRKFGADGQLIKATTACTHKRGQWPNVRSWGEPAPRHGVE